MAFRTQKISQMTPKGANLEATDLIEVSTIESGSYVTRSITGQEIIDAAVGNVDWGDIGGTLSAQTDLQTALNAKQNTLSLTTTGSSGASTLVGATLNVPNYTLSGLGGVPTSRTLTINGVTQDLSADRTFTISTGITIGSTAIASGVVGRVLFEGAGNVVQESSSLFWDATNNRLGIGTSTPTGNVDINASFTTTGYPLIVKNTGYFNAFFQGTSANNQASFYLENDRGSTLSYGGFAIGGSTSTLGNIFGLTRADRLFMFADGPNIAGYAIGTLQNVPLQFGTNNNIRTTIFGNGNVGIGTTTDAGFKLDVNGTGRFSGNLTVATGFEFWFNNGNVGLYRSANTLRLGGFGGIEFLASATTITSQTIRMKIFDTGNIGINTTTDAGFRLDVNGSGRFNNEFILNRSDGVEMFRMNNSPAVLTFNGNNSSTPTLRFHSQSNILFYLKASENRIGINTTTPNASAILDVTSTTQGFLPPRMTTTERNAIASPAAGLVVYDNTDNKHYGYNGTTWNAFY